MIANISEKERLGGESERKGDKQRLTEIEGKERREILDRKIRRE